MTIAIDFDETIAFSKFPDIQGMRPFADKVIHEWRSRGHYIIVGTCRCGGDLVAAVNFMLENGIEFDRINDNRPSDVAKYGGSNSRKVNADIYIDDHNLGGFPGWIEAKKIVDKMELTL